MAERNGNSKFSTQRYELLHSLIIDNIEHFRKRHGKYSARFLEDFSQFLDHLNAVEVEIDDLLKVVHLYDLDADTPANGYRSLISVMDSFVELITKLCREVIIRRRHFTFSKRSYFGKVSECTRLLGGLLAILRISQAIRLKNAPGTLFSFYDEAFHERIFMNFENVDRTCFYESFIAFQFDESIQKSIRFICIMVATFSHVYYASGGNIPRLCSGFINYCRYSHSPRKLSHRFFKLSRNATVDFYHTFWNLQSNRLKEQVTDSVAIDKKLMLLPEPLQLTKDDGSLIDIPIPSSHTAISPVVCKLVCAHVREGQLEESEQGQQLTDRVKAASPYLIIHLHGSGYIAGPSTEQNGYLKAWAVRLDAPILCIYHSLAPEAPYPRLLEDCLYAYAWAIKNSHRLGSTGGKICLAGCSAGGDLITSLTIKAIQLGIRIPDGILSVCPAIITNIQPSPSSLLFLMDPLIPLELALSCIEAYTGNPGKPEGMFANRSLGDGERLLVRVKELHRRVGTDDPLKSTFLVSDSILAQFPPVRFMSTHMDPVVDNIVTFSRRMKALGKDVRLDVLGKLAHGFLNFASVSQAASDGSSLCIQRIRDLLQMPPQHGIS